MTFAPLNQDHAIAMCQYGVALTKPLPAVVVKKLAGIGGTFAEILPARAMVDVSDMGDEPVTHVLHGRAQQGLVASWLRPDGAAVWQLQVYHNQIDIRATRYTRWASMWQTASEIFQVVLGAVGDTDKDIYIGAVGHRMVDRFLGPAEYKLSSILRHGPLVPEHLFAAGRVWHCNSGWFSAATGDAQPGRILTTLEMDAKGRLEDDEDGAETTVSISHSQSHLLGIEGRQVSNLPRAGESLQTVESSFSLLHRRNKELLAGLLVPALLKEIGLENAK